MRCPSDSRRAAMNLAGGTLWHVPGSFNIVRILGSRYSLRCVLFHDISDAESSFTRGLGCTTTRTNFEATLKFLTKHFTPVSLQEVLASLDGRLLPPRPVLVTFDDAYASVCEFAAPLCRDFQVPAVFFVNAACLDNRELALDNLICYVTNVSGLDTINAAIRIVRGSDNYEVHSLTDVFSRFLPAISLSARKSFREELVRLSLINENELAREARLYLSSQQLGELSAFNFEIGNHTYSHVNCRVLSTEEFAEEIDQNRAVLEALSKQKIRTFSVPYGSSDDLTTKVLGHLQRSGYEANFLAEGRTNSDRTPRLQLDRVSIKAVGDAALFSEIEVLPRLRSARNRLLFGSDWGSPQRGSRRDEGMPSPWHRAPMEDASIGTTITKEDLEQ